MWSGPGGRRASKEGNVRDESRTRGNLKLFGCSNQIGQSTSTLARSLPRLSRKVGGNAPREARLDADSVYGSVRRESRSDASFLTAHKVDFELFRVRAPYLYMDHMLHYDQPCTRQWVMCGNFLRGTRAGRRARASATVRWDFSTRVGPSRKGNGRDEIALPAKPTLIGCTPLAGRPFRPRIAMDSPHPMRSREMIACGAMRGHGQCGARLGGAEALVRSAFLRL